MTVVEDDSKVDHKPQQNKSKSSASDPSSADNTTRGKNTNPLLTDKPQSLLAGSTPPGMPGKSSKPGASKYQYIQSKEDIKGNRLEATATLVLETKLATSLWRGRQGNNRDGIHDIVGLTRFAREVGNCWREAKLNNPVADYYLIQVEKRFGIAQAELKESMAVVKELMDDSFQFENFKVINKSTPFSAQLRFDCTWGFLGAKLLKEYDELVKTCLALKHMGILSESSWGTIKMDAGRRLRGLFQSLDSFIAVPIDRDWFRNPDLRVKLKDVRRFYRMANREMPFLDKDILHGERRATLSPPILDAKLRQEIRDKEAFNGGNMAAKVATMGIRKSQAIENGKFLVGSDAKKLPKKKPTKS